MIPAGRQTALYAPAKQGKSEIALAIVAAVATGKPILGRPNHEGPRHVVWLDYEMTQADLFERLDMLGYEDTDDLQSSALLVVLPSLPPLDTQAGCDVVRALAAHFDAELVVIDTMGRAVEGDENDNDTYRAYALLTGLDAEGRRPELCCGPTTLARGVLEKGQRGASAKNDDADVVLRVEERTSGGWKLKRTHPRLGWVPDTTLIDRVELPDVTLKITWDQGTTTYPAGTGDLVKDMRAIGITSRRRRNGTPIAAMKQAGPKARANKLQRRACVDEARTGRVRPGR